MADTDDEVTVSCLFCDWTERHSNDAAWDALRFHVMNEHPVRWYRIMCWIDRVCPESLTEGDLLYYG